jgi:uncharacterized membrane protein
MHPALSFARRLSPLFVACTVAVLVLASSGVVLAQDLQAGFEQASTSLRGLIATGVAVISGIIAVVGLMMTAFKFSQKDPGAIWNLVGTAAAGVLCAAAVMMNR